MCSGTAHEAAERLEAPGAGAVVGWLLFALCLPRRRGLGPYAAAFLALRAAARFCMASTQVATDRKSVV